MVGPKTTKARARHITGTHIYGYLKCPRAVQLDLVGDRSQRRPLMDHEEFVLQRGRDHEASIVEALGWPEPEYEPRDWEAGAHATRDLLASGIDGVQQGVLLGERRLGIPDLLRRVEGASAFGNFHYVVGDIKSSARARSDQVLQVVFYSRLLASLQDRGPDYGYLVLKDGSEWRFNWRDYEPVLEDIEAALFSILDGARSERPFGGRECGSCRWEPVCSAEMVASADLSLLQGMTRGLRTTMEGLGVRTPKEAAVIEPEALAQQAQVESALFETVRSAARAAQAAEPQRTGDAVRGLPPPGRSVLVHLLADAYTDSVLWIGMLRPAIPGGSIVEFMPRSPAELRAAFEALAAEAGAGGGAALLHYGYSVPRWLDVAAQRADDADVPLTGALSRFESRLVDLQRIVRGAAVFPAPVFGLADHVRWILGDDPHRAGRADAAAMWAQAEDRDRVRAKGATDLHDLARLLAWCRERGEVGAGDSVG